ncbi:TetR family transcriptional regulator [Amycolatopsis antarctica]|uniref:TetR family transcriptional regulator n=1 Tax=Amycolatopsis antarctica TaxID=1854586 RepID=A0A263D8I8_9PSEU|nr:TetR family transcriptional regulator [Amycolatopsis antarctica]OZM74800.1 TetR family transcriptional regulator [Amycolatopsis antarctica]
MTDRPAGRKRDSAATREALLAAATELFTTRGFDRTSVREIAALAEVNQALVFRYFGSKEELLGAVLTAPGRALLAEADPDELLTGLLRQMFGAGERPGQGGNLLLLALSGPQRGVAAEVLEREVARPLREALAASTDAPDATLRAELVLAWMLGLALARQIRPDGALASAGTGAASTLVLDAVRALLSGTGD